MSTIAAASIAQAQPVSYTIDPAHTKVYWEVRHFGTSTHRGRFDRVEGGVTMDRTAKRGDASISVTTASVSSGVAPLDGILRGNNFLASTEHPTAYFVAGAMRFDGERVAELRGELTLRGVSRPLSLRATAFGCRIDATWKREVCGGDFEAAFKRSEFGSTFGLPFVGDEVKLSISVEAISNAP